MSDKILICPFFGDLPPWMDDYWRNADRLKDQGYNFLLDDDEDAFRDRVYDLLGIKCPQMWGTGNIWDFRPALGYLYWEEIQDFDWWGHTDFDCVYGRVDEFVTDEVLAECDVFTDCAHDYISGPWSLYRNTPEVTNLFLSAPGWHKNLTSPDPTGWCETTFTDFARKNARLTVVDNHAYTHPHLLRMDGDKLMHGKREIMYYHFRRTKEWPL